MNCKKFKILKYTQSSYTYLSRIVILNILLFALIESKASVNLDSLYNSYKNQKLSDTLRLQALNDYIFYGTLNSNPDSALYLAKQLLKLAQQKSQPRFIVKAYSSIGNCYLKKFKFKDAEGYYNKGLELSKQINYVRGTVVTNINLGALYYDMSKYIESINYYEVALNQCSKLNDSTLYANILVNLGAIYYDLEELETAQSYFVEGLKFAKKDSKNTARCYNNIGSIYSDRNEIKKALYFLKKSLFFHKQSNDKYSIAEAYNSIGYNFLLIHEFDSAYNNLMTSLKIQSKFDDEYIICDTYGFLSIYYQLKKDNRSAENYALKSLNLAIKYNRLQKIIEASNTLYDIYKLENNPSKALKMLELRSSTKDSLMSENNLTAILKYQLKSEYEKKRSNDLNKLVLKELEVRNSRLLVVVLLLLLALSLFSIIYSYRSKNLKSKLKIQELEQSLLRLHMNPHFIFNSLNSIQGFYADNNSSDAKRYLNKFSLLLRMILENSNKSQVSLAEEINMVTNYLELSLLRSDHPFMYTITIDPLISTNNTFIPPMIIQPFIENSFLHGIKPKQINGEVELTITIENQKLRVEISDNGPGFEYEIVKSSTNKKTSTGVIVSQKRIAFANSTKNEFEYFRMRNLYDSDMNVIGCSTIFYLPLITL